MCIENVIKYFLTNIIPKNDIDSIYKLVNISVDSENIILIIL